MIRKLLIIKRPESLLLAAIGLFFFIYKLPDHFSLRHILPYYLFDYSFGFIKRGFIGQLFTFIPVSVSESLIVSFNILLLILFIFIFIKIIEKINFKDRAIEYLLIIFLFTCPSLLKNIWYDLKFDIIGILYCALTIALPNKFNRSLLFFSPILLFIHEGFIFLWIPSIVSCILIKGNLSIKKNSLLFIIFLFIVGFIMFLIKLYGDLDVDTNYFISHLNSKLSPTDKKITEITTNLMAGNVSSDIQYSIIANFTKIKFWGYGLTILLSVFTFIKFISDLYKIKLKSYIYNITVPLIFIFFMFFLGWDGLRWFSNITFSVLLIFIAILHKNNTNCKNITIDYTNYKFHFLIALLILYIPFNNMGVIYW